jgi:hypothetical protein
MTKTEHKNLSSPDETRSFEHGKVEIINIGQGTVGRLTLEPEVVAARQTNCGNRVV